jgi:uncharacterized protein with HEPN domain
MRSDRRVHDYFRVDWSVVYTTAARDLPVLQPLVQAILAALPPDPDETVAS